MIQIDHVHLIVRTRGRPASRGGTDTTPPPLLHLHLKEILIDSADEQWKTVSVVELLARRKEQHQAHVLRQQQQAGQPVQAELIDVRKLIRVGSITIGLGVAVEADSWWGVKLSELDAQLPPSMFGTRVMPLLNLSLGIDRLPFRTFVDLCNRLNVYSDVRFALRIATKRGDERHRVRQRRR